MLMRSGDLKGIMLNHNTDLEIKTVILSTCIKVSNGLVQANRIAIIRQIWYGLKTMAGYSVRMWSATQPEQKFTRHSNQTSCLMIHNDRTNFNVGNYNVLSSMKVHDNSGFHDSFQIRLSFFET